MVGHRNAPLDRRLAFRVTHEDLTVCGPNVRQLARHNQALASIHAKERELEAGRATVEREDWYHANCSDMRIAGVDGRCTGGPVMAAPRFLPRSTMGVLS